MKKFYIIIISVCLLFWILLNILLNSKSKNEDVKIIQIEKTIEKDTTLVDSTKINPPKKDTIIFIKKKIHKKIKKVDDDIIELPPSEEGC